MKHQVLFSLKNNEKIFKTVVCCSRDWRLTVKRAKLKETAIADCHPDSTICLAKGTMGVDFLE